MTAMTPHAPHSTIAGSLRLAHRAAVQRGGCRARIQRGGCRARTQRGFTLVELIIAILVLGMGLVMLAAVFPAGIAQQQFANDDVYGRIVADHAISVIRGKVSPEDFGTFEQFYLTDQRPTGGGGGTELPYRVGGVNDSVGFSRGIPGDWSWKRPGFVFDGNGTTADDGKIDIFSWETYRTQLTPTPEFTLAADQNLLFVDNLARANEFPNGLVPIDDDVPPLFQQPSLQRHTVFGIPFNREKYDSDLNVFSIQSEIVQTPGGVPQYRTKEPAKFILQSERTWPQMPGSRPTPGQYFWECMFRRFEGKIYVAIFVYRVAAPGGEPRRYSVPQAPSGTMGQPQANTNLPPLPVTIRLDNAANSGVGALPNPAYWRFGTDLPPGGNATSQAFSLAAQAGAWQYPGQWIVDKFNNVHRVVNGRRTLANGPVRFARPIPAVPQIPAIVGQAAGPAAADQATTTIDQIWFMPTRDAAGNTLIPVFCTVQEL